MLPDRFQGQEGVIKFKQRFTKCPLPESYDLRGIDSWRTILHDLNLIGQDPQRYRGAGYGNISKSVGSDAESKGKRKFVITGTQTGGSRKLTRNHYTTVLECDLENNLIVWEGPIEPSSEAETHSRVYHQHPSIGYVFHVHSPEIWGVSKKLNLPTTAEGVEYGTPEMAKEVERLAVYEGLLERKIFSMAGHKDGIVSFGKTAEEAGLILMESLAKARSILSTI